MTQNNIRTSTLLNSTGLKTTSVWPVILLAAVVFLAVYEKAVHAVSTPTDSALLPADVTPGQALSLQRQAEPAPPNPLIYLDIWLFGGLILIVALIVAVKYLWKAIQPDNRDPSEGLQPWERPDYDDE